MKIRDFLKAGHTPSLFCAFLYFDVSFMVWVLVGALANSIAPDERFQLDNAQRGLMVGLPILGGAILRIVLGIMTDRVGAKMTGVIGLVATLAPLLLGWLWVETYTQMLIVGLLLGIAGASFAAALPLASRWYPPQYQGLAMGIAGAGNSGTAIATFFGPQLAEVVGWQGVFGLALIPIGLTLIAFNIFAKDSPNQPAPKPIKDYGSVLRHADTWWFCLFYLVTFGGFVGLASYLNSFFRIQYGLTPQEAGIFTTLCVISGSFLRPVGGFLADYFGGIRMLILLYVGVGAGLLGQASLPDFWLAVVLLFLAMGCLGMGNGAVFQLVPQRFPKEIGVVTGIVGAAGGVGGFLLPTLLGAVKEWTGSFTGAFVTFALASLISAGVLMAVGRTWERAFVGLGGKAPGVDPMPLPPLPTPAPALEVPVAAQV